MSAGSQQALVKIKNLKDHKLDQAQKALQKAQQQLAQLTAQLQNTQQQWQEYRAWRIQEEDRLYQAAENQLMSAKKLDELREKIALMRQKDTQFQQEILQLKEKVAAAKSHKNQCQLAVNNAQKDVEKYTELLREEARIQYLIQERLSEEMLDEFASARHEVSQ